MTGRVNIHGAGPAGCAAVLALRSHGVPVELSLFEDDRPSPPVVLNEAAVALLVKLYGSSSLFEDAHQLRRRIVRWGAEPERVIVQPAISIASSVLRQRLLAAALRRLDSSCRVDNDSASRDRDGTHLLFDAEDAKPPGTTSQRFGRRVMLSTIVTLAVEADPTVYWMEGCEDGWVFLAPLAGRRAALQVTLSETPSGHPAKALAAIIDSTFHIRRLIAVPEEPVSVHRTGPALTSPATGRDWFAIGRAVMSLDPVCGDGTAQAIRSGLLAAGVVTAIKEGGNRDALVEHFSRRLLGTFTAHLSACAQFYNPAVFVRNWQEEIAIIRRAAADFTSEPQPPPKFSFQNLKLLALS